MQSVSQAQFFEGMGYKEHAMQYPCGLYICYEGSRGHFFRIDHFDNLYVIEFADNEKHARMNMFEDCDTFPDDMPPGELIAAIQKSIQEDP